MTDYRSRRDCPKCKASNCMEVVFVDDGGEVVQPHKAVQSVWECSKCGEQVKHR